MGATPRQIAAMGAIAAMGRSYNRLLISFFIAAIVAA